MGIVFIMALFLGLFLSFLLALFCFFRFKRLIAFKAELFTWSLYLKRSFRILFFIFVFIIVFALLGPESSTPPSDNEMIHLSLVFFLFGFSPGLALFIAKKRLKQELL